MNLIRAENLKKEDIFGESDPYATLQVGGGKKKQTKTVTNTSNPQWFYTADFPIDMVKGPVLKIQVFDCDGKGKKFKSDQFFLFTSDEFELEFSSSSRAELGHFNFRAETKLDFFIYRKIARINAC